MTWLYIFASVIIVSLISLIGVFVLAVSEEKMRKIIVYLVSFAAGSLLGDAFIHLLPEAFESIENKISISLSVICGFLIFFIIEKFFYWRHCHEIACDEHPHAFSYVLLAGDTLHNFIDGLAIAASFLAGFPVGMATTLAVIFHEIPQEIGDFGSLIYAGFKKMKALFFNFLTALAAILGAFFILILGGEVKDNYFLAFLIPFTAGGFIYVGASDLIPEIKKEKKLWPSVVQLLCFGSGLLVMYALTFLE